jgi:hypothetical protein
MTKMKIIEESPMNKKNSSLLPCAIHLVAQTQWWSFSSKQRLQVLQWTIREFAIVLQDVQTLDHRNLQRFLHVLYRSALALRTWVL